MSTTQKTTAVLGASPKPDRYSHMAMMRLKEAGHRAIPVNPAYTEIEGLPVVPDLASVAETVGRDGLDTVTVYVGAYHLDPLVPGIIGAAPRRVIFNPGTESPGAQAALSEAGIEWLEACTLVLLATGQY